MAKDEYELAQEEWVKQNNIHIGSKVKVLRTARSDERGWDDIWLDDMDDCVGFTGIITPEFANDVFEYGIRVEFSNMGAWYFPYFVLEPVENSDEPSYEDIAKSLAKYLSHTGNCPMGVGHKCPCTCGGFCLDKADHSECWIEAAKKELRNNK